MRLNKLLAVAGVASRRQADQLIAAGRVWVNGVKIIEMGVQVDPQQDRVVVDDQPVLFQIETEKVHYIMHKPVGYLTTVSDPFGRPTVMELLPEHEKRVYPVGRLDLNTSGLLFFTNDGQLALALTHPRHLVEKTYLAKVKGVPSPQNLKQLAEGIELSDGLTAPAQVNIEGRENGNAILSLIIREGRKRQVRRMLLAVGHPVISLSRQAMGPLVLGDLRPGQVRRPTPEELAQLLSLKKRFKTADS